jgi:hypothetical protein
MSVDYLARITKIEAAIDATLGTQTTRLTAQGETVEFANKTYDELMRMLRDAKAGAVRAGQMTRAEAGLGGAVRVRTFAT